jgi:hypothetical protein
LPLWSPTTLHVYISLASVSNRQPEYLPVLKFLYWACQMYSILYVSLSKSTERTDSHIALQVSCLYCFTIIITNHNILEFRFLFSSLLSHCDNLHGIQLNNGVTPVHDNTQVLANKFIYSELCSEHCSNFQAVTERNHLKPHGY